MADESVKQVNKQAAVKPNFKSGDTVNVYYKIIEGEKTRIQPYQGIVISRKGHDMSKSFTVRRLGADGVGVERIFQLHSPNIEKIELVKSGRVRRAKLYYLRDKKGSAAYRIKESPSSKKQAIKNSDEIIAPEPEVIQESEVLTQTTEESPITE